MREDLPILTVVICDDDERGRRDEWGEEIARLLGSSYQLRIDALDSKAFNDEYNELLNRRSSAREARDGETDFVLEDLPLKDEWSESVFDKADVLLVDYDLYQFREHEYLTGSVLAYLVRCFSRCRVVVGVNERGPNPFDLTLADAPESFTDLIIGEDQIGNRRLWLGQARGEPAFRPWYWPALVDLQAKQEAAAKRCQARLQEHVLDLTGLERVYEWLPRSALGWLEMAGDEAHQQQQRTTLLQLARGARLGLRRGDEAASVESLARIGAARVRKWVSRVVLPLQDVLIDAPHLASRLPGLVEAAERDLDVANATAAVPSATAAECQLRTSLDKYTYSQSEWVPSAAFYWPELSRNRDLPGVGNPLDFPPLPGVFCEDLSAFLPEGKARRFVSRLDSASPARWVAEPEESGIEGLTDVEYQPLSRLAL